MVPAAGRAHFDYVAREVGRPLAELVQLCLRGDAVTPGAETGAEHVGDENDVFLFADRTQLLGGFADVLGGAQ